MHLDRQKMRLALFSFHEKIPIRFLKKVLVCLKKRDGQKILSRIEVALYGIP